MSLSEKLEAARVALGKRKERERELQAAQALAQAPVPAVAEPEKPAVAEPGKAAPARAAGNKMLAGHLAHEFLAHGTLLGRRIEPSRSVPAPVTAPAALAEPDPKRRYAEVSVLLMTTGAHMPGVVNPTQLGRWLQIKD
ncbi:hypothetical protein HU200_032517 [Digitaria exilis]|uniref:Uncharacterized protein n=1 Tax=Digitaria exilis TaxID=1010633 RepID=A0A835BYG3_9POAL|nr:hypothetical protein HU200_032517 [Digitaria exilis]